MAKTALEQWDETAANNLDRGGVNIGEGCNPSDVNNAMRELMSQVAKWLGDDTIASAATTDLGSKPGRYVEITGTTTITGFGTIKAGTIKFVKFAGALTLTHNATSLILPGATNIVTAAGDTAVFVSEGSGNWRCLSYQRAAVPLARFSASPSNAASVLFTGLPTTVRSWRLELINLRPAVDGEALFARASASGTSVTSGYQSFVNRNDYNLAGPVNVPSTSGFIVSSTVGNASNEGSGLSLTLQGLGQAEYTRLHGTGSVVNQDGAVRGLFTSGVLMTATAYTELLIFYSSGNIVSGEIRLVALD